MGVTDTGKLEVGLAADILLFDEDVNVERTIVDGRTIYKKGE